MLIRPLLLLLPLLPSCGHPVNFVDVASPRFEGRYAPPPPAAPPAEIRVVTFNVKYARAIDRAIEVLRQSDSLRGADIIALQEMDDAGTERIARALRLNYAFLPSTIHAVTDTFFGPAVLTRWRIDSAWRVPFPHASVFRGQRRTATAALIRIGRERLRVYSVHLETQGGISAEERVEQADAVMQDAAGARERIIVAGDLNSYGIGEYFIQNGFLWLTQSFGETFMLWGWDHVLARGFSRDQVQSVGVERNARGASDHRPVWAVLALSGGTGEKGRERARRGEKGNASPAPLAPAEEAHQRLSVGFCRVQREEIRTPPPELSLDVGVEGGRGARKVLPHSSAGGVHPTPTSGLRVRHHGQAGVGKHSFPRVGKPHRHHVVTSCQPLHCAAPALGQEI